MLPKRYVPKIQRRLSQFFSFCKFQSIVHGPSTNKLVDSFGRNHSYLRISLTERCRYCMPMEGIRLTPNDHLLQTEEILYLAKIFIKQGVTKIRLTGGEPTIYRDLKYIIENLNQIGSLKVIGMTTNGLTLTKNLRNLQKAGLNALNISLDTLSEEKFEMISRRKGHSRVMAGIDYALKLGFSPVKVNCVVMRNINDNELSNFVELTRDKHIDVRFIEYMPFGGNNWCLDNMVSYAELLSKIQILYPGIYQVKTGFNDTSKMYRVPDFVGCVGFISSISDNFCGSCNRLRLLADGSLKVCLLGTSEVSLRDALRNGCSEDDILALINASILRKKKQHADYSDTVITRNLLTLSPAADQIDGAIRRHYSTLTHITKDGGARMVNVGSKNESERYASAYAEVVTGRNVCQMICDNQMKKGDVLIVAKLAGIIAAKNTFSIIPLCHMLSLSFVEVQLVAVEDRVQITSYIRCKGRTGVEMEALTAVTVAALTVYDMCKAVSHDISIENVKLLEKKGGKNNFIRQKN